MRRVYRGPVPSDSTTTNLPPNETLVNLVASSVRRGGKVLDYGAGKWGRHAKALRKRGFKVYAYDPFHGTDVSGWKGISNKKPRGNFDMVVTAFVLNVVKLDVEEEILAECAQYSDRSVHMVRGRDLVTMMRRCLKKRTGVVTEFFMDEFLPRHKKGREEWEKGEISEQTLMDFCHFGTVTSRGFQRLPRFDVPGTPVGDAMLFELGGCYA